MYERISGALGLAGFLMVAGSAGALELGGSLIAFVFEGAAGLALMIIALIYYKSMAYLEEERYKQSLEYRRMMQDEDGIERRPDSY